MLYIAENENRHCRDTIQADMDAKEEAKVISLQICKRWDTIAGTLYEYYDEVLIYYQQSN